MQPGNANLTAPRPAASALAISEPVAERVPAVLFLIDDATEFTVRAGLADLLGSVQIRRGGLRAAHRALQQEQSPRVLLVDISDADNDPLKALDALATVCAPDTKVLLIGDRNDVEFYRLVTRHLGVNEYLKKPLTREGVTTLIGPYVAGAEPERERNRAGRVVTVFGARGGVGATTVAINLALHISEQTRCHVALLDLHLRAGHAPMMLGVRPGPGLRLALESPGRVDGVFLERVAISGGDRLSVVAAEEPFESEPAPTTEGVTHVVDLLRQRFNVVIIDIPTPPSGAMREALRMSRQALIVFGPDVGSIRDARDAKRMVTGQIGSGRVMTVLNRANCPGALKFAFVEEGMGGKPEIIIPDLPKLLPRAANLGQPALRESAVLRRALSPLTQEISGVEQPELRSGLLNRLSRRFRHLAKN